MAKGRKSTVPRKPATPPVKPAQVSKPSWPQKAINQFERLWTWVPAPMSAALVGFGNWLLGLSGITIIIATAAVFFVVLAVVKTVPTPRWKVSALAVIFLIAGYAGYRSYQDEQKIELESPGAATAFAVIEPGSRFLGGAKFDLMFQNPNNYPVTARIHRSWFSVNGLTGLAVGSDEIVTLPARMTAPKPIGTQMRFVIPFRPEGAVEGNVDSQICFSKDGGSTFPLSHRMKGKITWEMDSDGRLGIMDFEPAEPKEQNEGFYEGCHR